MTTRNEKSFSHGSLLAAAFFGFLLGSGYSSTHVDAQNQLAIPAIPAATEAFEYFPAQYANQAKEASEHVQAF